MGSPATELLREADEAAHKQRIGHSFANSTEEVTITQFQSFRENYSNRRYGPTDDCPSNNVTWFEAAAYCCWLSEQAGLPGEQMCYPAEAEIGPGMKLPDNWFERTGYRLPTEAEWEFACRGGVNASCYFGEGDRLQTHYAWFRQNSDNHAWTVGQLKPNNFGLFDMLGNVAERCQDAMATYPTSSVTVVSDTPTEPQSSIGASDIRVFRGGSFGDIDSNIRSARRSANTVQDAWVLTGFRPARTLSP
jgi:formylglycine-generating enzyme required for sulfatase activity